MNNIPATPSLSDDYNKPPTSVADHQFYVMEAYQQRENSSTADIPILNLEN